MSYLEDMFNLEEKVVIITGATGQIVHKSAGLPRNRSKGYWCRYKSSRSSIGGR